LPTFLLLANLSTSAWAAAEPIVTVVEDLGSARVAWPVSTGFPLPPGLAKDDSSIALEDTAGGGKLPVQTRVLARWPDGSVRWVLIDTALDLAARRSRKLRVRVSSFPRRSTRCSTKCRSMVRACREP
jgi:hypothetical protein